MTPMVVLLVGCGITTLGLVDSELWVIGLLIASIGAIGVLVRLADWVRLSRE
jgi:hypothetical protein